MWARWRVPLGLDPWGSAGGWLNYPLVFGLFIAVAFARPFSRSLSGWENLTKPYRSYSEMWQTPAAGMIGFASPCFLRPLVYDFWARALHRSAIEGAEFAVGFGLGTLPLLWLAQSEFMRVRQFAGPFAPDCSARDCGNRRLGRDVAACSTLGIEAAVDWICR